MEKTYTAKQLLTAYMNLKRELDKLNAAHDENTKDIKSRMEFAKNELNKKMQEEELDNLTHKGIAKAFFQSVRTMKINDWEAALDYIKKNNMFHVLQRSLSKNSVWELVDESKTPFPGVELGTIRDLKINKA